MKHINKMILLGVIMGLTGGLMYGPTSINLIFAAQPDPCFVGDCTAKMCDNSPGKLKASCCWSKPGVIPHETVCQTCEVNTNTGEFENCTDITSKGSLDSGVKVAPPSGKAPPTSTETCPDNVAVDKNGNCGPSAQLADVDNNDGSDNDKPNLRGNVLNDLMFSQSQDSSISDEGQGEEGNNKANH
ncbi:MAG TPA: hypothetical protein VFG45_08905 [Candidatus Nitrosocosmicus sp.]|nr:hypothetical protein [Candidatus Nitrosocosmicus sp.]